jgi:hypothetical protein
MTGLDYPRSPGFDRLGLWSGRALALVAAAGIGAIAYARFVTGIGVSDGTNIYRATYGDTRGYRAAQDAAGAEAAAKLTAGAVGGVATATVGGAPPAGVTAAAGAPAGAALASAKQLQ